MIKIPKGKFTIRSSRQNLFRGTVKACMHKPAAMSKCVIDGHKLVFFDVPKLRCSVQTCSQELGAIRTEVDTVHAIIMQQRRGKFFTRVNLPEFHLAIVTCCREELFI